MKKDLIKIITTLEHANEPVTSRALADILDVSPRSIKNYVTEINDLYPGTISSSRKGYTINPDYADEILQESSSLIPQTPEERVIYIINILIKKGIYNAYDLCDELFISYSTLKGDLIKVRRMLKDTNLELISQNDMLFINGLEKNKRKLLSTLIYSESHNNFVNKEKLSESFADMDVDFVKTTIMNKFDEFHYFVNDYSLENLILHSTICIDRIRNGFSSMVKTDNPVIFKSHERDLAQAIIREFEERFNVHFSDVEVDEFTMLILSRASNLDYEEVTVDNIRSYVGEDIFQLAQDIIADFSAYFYIDLSQPEFFVRFALHIKNLLVRAESDYFSKNPLTDSIKQNCPLIYDCAVNAARLIKERTGIRLSDDEIAYIAFHLGGALEIQNTLKNKINAVVFFPGYYNYNSKFANELMAQLPQVLNISAILTHQEELEKVNCDMIISTLSLKLNNDIPVVVVSPFVTNQDMHNIAHKIESVRKEMSRKAFRENLSLLIKPELFKVTDQVYTKENVIHLMAERLRQLGYVGDRFESEVLDRDAVSSTAFGTFAIPHAMKMHEKRTGINIMILQNPVDWDGREVKLIMMLCFNINERYLFNELFEPISMILIDPQNLNKVLKAKNAEQFIDTLAELML